MRRMTRFLSVVTAIAMAAALAGCGSAGEASTESSSPSGVTLTLGDQGLLKPLVEAADALEGAPYKIKWAEFQAAPPMFAALQAGRIDTTYGGDSTTLHAMGNGSALKLVAGIQTNGSTVAIVAQKSSKVRSIDDLKGKTVAVSPAEGSLADYLLFRALKDAGLAPDDIETKYLLPAAGQAAFSSGQVEVWATVAPFTVMAENSGARVLVDGSDGRTSGLSLIAASSKNLDDPQKKAALTDVLARIQKAMVWSRAHTDEWAEALASATGMEIPLVKLVIALTPQNLIPLDTNTVSRIQTVADTMYEAKWVTRKITAASAVDAGVVKAKKTGGSDT
ncbi:ABC transporter substrate-binding protein [Streptomyces adelaidensis]|uniref:ABC transporter substrate-binding protein n=1 Tax=Streptomyces adelaidensis TaxID=2796465 RepID=UPI001907D708|nr:ABC transporter substrate-binding protein [Streptomyces adelaidensis]